MPRTVAATLAALVLLASPLLRGQRLPPRGAAVGVLRGRPARGLPHAPPADDPPLTPEEIRRVVLRHLGALSRCHDRPDGGAPRADGRYSVRFVIAPSGRVRGVRTYPAGREAASDACVIGVFAAMVFPRPRGGATVTVDYPGTICGLDA